MRVVHLRADNNIYGAERVILTLAKEQRRQGIDAQVVCLERAGTTAFFERLEAEGIPAHRVESRGRIDGRALLHLKRTLDEQVRPEIIHSHGYKTDAFAAVLRPILRRRAGLVATNHLWTNETARLKVYETIDALAFRAFDKIVAVSEAIAEEMRDRGVPEDKVEVIQNGLDYGELDAQAHPGQKLRAELRAFDPDSLFIGFVGRLSPQKGINYLLDAAARLHGRKNVYFVIIGEGELRPAIERQLKGEQLDDRVFLLGRRDDVPDLLSELDIVVLPSLREGTPMALLEAMGVGRAVVASAVGGVRDVVEDGRTGLIVAPTDVPALAAAIEHLVDHAGERQQIGAAAAASVREKFSGAAMTRRYTRIYKQVAPAD
ncbi:MAG TPA: glycosyltransferase [Polyangia bacterium]|jgi:glycosyltransferase involved in cell wall biosynthesis